MPPMQCQIANHHLSAAAAYGDWLGFWGGGGRRGRAGRVAWIGRPPMTPMLHVLREKEHKGTCTCTARRDGRWTRERRRGGGLTARHRLPRFITGNYIIHLKITPCSFRQFFFLCESGSFMIQAKSHSSSSSSSPPAPFERQVIRGSPWLKRQKATVHDANHTPALRGAADDISDRVMRGYKRAKQR